MKGSFLPDKNQFLTAKVVVRTKNNEFKYYY